MDSEPQESGGAGHTGGESAAPDSESRDSEEERLPPILADYDSEPREPKPRPDGYLHVDSPALVERLVGLSVNTYAFLLYHSPSDWDDLSEYLALAELAGLTTWVYLVPPSELPSYYPPYESDYVAWAEAVGQLAAAYPSVTALAMDDFNSNTSLFTGDYVCEMMEAAHKSAPGLKFYAVDYYPDILSDFAHEEDRRCIDGVIFPYTDLDSNARLRQQIDEIAAMREGYSDSLQISYPWNRKSVAGSYGRFTATCTAGELSFTYSDDFPYGTAGYHKARVREAGVSLWEEDVADTEGSERITLHLSGGQLSVGIEEDLGVSNFGVTVTLADFQAKSCGEWSWESTDESFTSAFTDVEGWAELELIPMIYATSTSWHAEVPATAVISEAVELSLGAWEDGVTQGVITYCLDKSEGSEAADAVGAIYAGASP